MIWFIQTIPNVVERMVNQIESPAIQDMFVRLITTEESTPGIIEWLSAEGLVPRLIAYLSPNYPPTSHVIAADLLKITISICALQTQPFNPAGGNAQEQAGGGQSKDNRLVRDMVSETSIATMLGFMLDDIKLTDSDVKASDQVSDSFVVHPLPSVSSASSSLTQICTILVELIRRNNSDFSEPHLFHTLRNQLMSVKSQQISSGAVHADDRVAMEVVMAEISPKLGIVHLGSLITQITARFSELFHFLIEPRSQVSLFYQIQRVANPRTGQHLYSTPAHLRMNVSESLNSTLNSFTAPTWPFSIDLRAPVQRISVKESYLVSTV
jgi:SIT4-associating protein SAP185/190